MKNVLQQIADFGIVPVVKIEDAKDAINLAKALKDGGLPVAEITFRTDAAEEAIKQIAINVPDVLVGAGTVLSIEKAKQAVNAGAEFIVTPAWNKSVVEFCIKNNVPVTPGTSTPTDIQAALDMGIEVVKFFPASVFGGMKALKAMSAPYTIVKFIPTGGVSTDNLVEYISSQKVHAVGGSWIAKSDMIKEGKFDEITRLVREAIDTMLGFELAHVGIYTENEESSLKVAKKLCSIFNFSLKEGNSANFAGTGIEVVKSKGAGSHGHIAIATNTITRACAWLERNGIKVDMSTAKEKDGELIAVYLKDEFAGFAIHLLQKK